LPGDGNMPLVDIIEEISGSGYNGGATIELVTNYINKPSLYSKLAIDRFRQLLKY
jgi:protein FrlC